MRVAVMTKSILAAIVTIFLMLSSGIAAADDPPEPPNPATGKSGPPSMSATVADALTHCEINSANPHHSFHFPDTIDATATASCAPGVFSITMIVTIWRVNLPLPDTPAGTSLPAQGSLTVTGVAAAPCINGTYY